MQLEKVYEPQRFEPHWAQWWLDEKLYAADNTSAKPMFSLVIPPPNVTGSLHMGHMLEHTMIDMVVRWKRMSGYNTLWLPGMDHAGIATQMVVERQLAQQNITRRELGREKFEAKVWEWKAVSGGRIVEQMKRTGASCDWTRERFTMDEGLSRAVREVFVGLWERGLVYRGEYMVNWCPRCNTALSDLEVAHEETPGSLWHIRYPVIDAQGGETGEHLVVATTRPETMLGDTAVAINPEDQRYLHLHGLTVRLPLMDREIPIILDELADPEFGTGVVKVTPAHDPNDFEAGKRHSLPHVKVIDEQARMTAEAGAYAGLDRFEARKKVVADLEALGLLAGIHPHALNVSLCDRCRTILEPLVSKQWFVSMKPLAERAMAAVEDGRTTIEPEQWRTTYFHWMRNIRDWCVSRQLWWGHRIPAWYCEECGHMMVARHEPEHCAECSYTTLRQETDVLDTWFSSGLWPFSTMGWPEQTADLKTFYPTSLMIMGYEILFFWCARMMMFGLECMDEAPFRQVYIHGIVRDAQGKKMSKTRGNTVDPLDITEKYGTDAVRMALLTAAAPGADILWTEDKLPASRAFGNKIWNAARFLFLNMERAGVEPCIPGPVAAERAADALRAVTSLEDRWIQSRLNAAADAVNRAMELNRYHEAAQTMWHFFWGEFCDWYIELKKLRFTEGSGLDNNWRNLLNTFEAALRLLSPAMPFLTEELWQRLANGAPGLPKSVTVAAYPQYSREAHDAEAERQMTLLQEIVTAARTYRADSKIDPKAKLAAKLVCTPDVIGVAGEFRDSIEKLAGLSLTVEEGAPKNAFDLLFEMSEADAEASRKRLGKEIEQLEKNIANSERQLTDEKFLARAPEHIVTSIKEKLEKYRSEREAKRAAVASL